MDVSVRLFRVCVGPAATLALASSVLVVPPAASAQIAPIVARYSSALASVYGRLSLASRDEMAQRLLLLSSYYQIDPRLLLAVVTVESNWRAGALSPVGAVGYGQLMPATAASLQVQSLEPYENLDGTARYLRRLMMRYASFDPATRVQLAVASYNAGPDAVRRYGGVPPYAQTRAYVRRVLAQWHRFSAMLDVPPSAVVTALVTRPSDLHPATARAQAEEPLAKAASKVIRPRHLAASTRSMLRLAAASESRATALLAVEPPPVVRYETSRSLFARLLGLRHRVVESAPSP
jgi:hypothetical protein